MIWNFAMPHRERLCSVDTAWLRMDRPANPMMICGVMAFDERLDFARFRDTVETRFLAYPRFRERVVQVGDAAYWEPDPHFGLSAHVLRTALPAPAGKAELQELVSELIGTPLDRSRPLWQYHVVEDYRGGSAVILRIHHCYADGVALVRVLLSMADVAPVPAPKSRGQLAVHQAQTDVRKRWFAPVTDAVDGALALGRSMLTAYWDLVLHPLRAFEYARQGLGFASEAAALALMQEDSRTRFKGKPGVAKRAAWAEPLPLFEVKAVGQALGCSINDVLLSCVAGALRAYLVEQGDAVEGVEIRALVPVNLRPADEDPATLGNYFGLVALLLPVGIENPLARLYEVSKRMQALKGSYQAMLTLGLLSAVGMGPSALQGRVLDMLAAKASAVITNVPGPGEPIYLAGARMTQMMFWVPQSGDIGMGASILSYNGRVQFGLVTDRSLVPDPENVVSRFGPEFEKLLLITLMMPWDAPPDPMEAERVICGFVGRGPSAEPCTADTR